MANYYSPPKAGDIVQCRFPQDRISQPGPKERPALVIEVEEYELPEGSIEVFVTVAYGTSEDVDNCHPGELKFESNQDAGLSFDTKFDLGNRVKLPVDEEWFAPSPNRRFGDHPKRGILNVADENLKRRLSSAITELKGASRAKAVDMTTRSRGHRGAVGGLGDFEAGADGAVGGGEAGVGGRAEELFKGGESLGIGIDAGSEVEAEGDFRALGERERRVVEAREPQRGGAPEVGGGGGAEGTAPARGEGLDAHGGMLELGLLGVRVGRGDREGVGGVTAHEAPAPVHGDECVARAHVARGTGFQDDAAAAAGHAGEIAISQAQIQERVLVQKNLRFRAMAEEARDQAGTRHAVPLVAQAPGGEADRVLGIGRFGRRRGLGGDEGRASPGGDTAARTGEMRRSEFVRVPSFSAQVAAGSRTSA